MRHYLSLNEHLRQRFGTKVYKLALDGGFTCPNRDGTLDTRGCIFCAGGSGDFAIPVGDDVFAAIENAKALVAQKNPGGKYIAYFQSYTCTYAPPERLRTLYLAAAKHPDICALAVGTRPDCLREETVAVLAEINRVKPLWVELGLQSVHESTARYIRRGYELPVFDNAVKRLKAAGLEVVVHMIIGLPGETEEMIYETAEHIAQCGADGVKFQLLHVLRGTDLAEDYLAGRFNVLTQEEYFRILSRCIELMPPETVIHRLTGDGAKRDLIAPLWSADKKRVMNALSAALDSFGTVQGSAYRARREH